MLIVMRGLSGSGKTTLRNKIMQFFYSKKTVSVYCPDDKLYNLDGKYVWTPQLANQAHKTTEKQFDDMVVNIAETYSNPNHYALLLDKQNIKWNDCKIYVELAVKCGHEVHFVETDTPWKFDENILFQKNVHNVPLETIRKNIQSWQKQSHFEYVFHNKYGYIPNYSIGFDDFVEDYRMTVGSIPSGWTLLNRLHDNN